LPSHRRPSVALSQNFIRNPDLVRELVQEMCLAPGDLVYEVGPGRGILTRELARRGCRVVAVERDVALARRLALDLACCPNATVHLADFLAFPLPAWPYKVAANPPFRIGSALLSRLFVDSLGPEEAHLVLQRELAQRVLGRTLFGLMIQPWFEPTITHRFRRSDFAPEPGVDVVMLRLRKRGPPLVTESDAQLFRDFLAYTFTHAHPTVASALRPVIDDLGPLGRRTCTQLALGDWLDIFPHVMGLAAEARATFKGAEARLRVQQTRLDKQHRTTLAVWT
jgi:16S rRNA A1518/A1519 N6-dimethyltransferase RsmA/KsgA/DIM1 with predicted DNA glycosylase/AP lyase activity